MFTLTNILAGLTVILAYAGFQFGLFKWLIGRIDQLGINFKDELVRHQQADLEALKQVRIELQAVREMKVTRRKRGK